MKLKTLFQAGIAGTIAFVVLIGGQLYNTASATDEAIKTAIQTWLEQNPEGGKAVVRYVEVCHHGVVSEVTPAPKPPITLAECTAMVGNDSLAKVILEAVDSVEAPAPLRWL